MKKIILASGSPRRKELMEQIGLKFEVAVSHKDEYYKSVLPEEIVKELSLMKAENVASEQDARNMIVIGADTIVTLDDKILGKPKDEKDAYYMLKSLQGKAHQVFTGVAILDYDSNGGCQVSSHAEATKVYVHKMEDDEIWRYIHSKEPMDKAGAYGIQGKFAVYIDKIEGDYYNVVGLPVSYVYQKVKKGVRPF
ncbi:Maf family protein [Muricomes intestini]|jgi:septum formation protein|uniref:dTTP/UTP pyrophosphatase n=1 Tax=Muricomes intestini TaxID=1796634 RepID=A0A4R3K784_9FIRM|nr:Maf family protein [Muricomes intestini]TCS78806.1 septum formation protein [Muricomes intestini]HAX50741.1 septum formation inhibitor Maf [Lachnospiraceae bacterium]